MGDQGPEKQDKKVSTCVFSKLKQIPCILADCKNWLQVKTN